MSDSAISVIALSFAARSLHSKRQQIFCGTRLKETRHARVAIAAPSIQPPSTSLGQALVERASKELFCNSVIEKFTVTELGD
jgi:hypothetical protein